MNIISPYNVQELDEVFAATGMQTFYLDDHLSGFDSTKHNKILDRLVQTGIKHKFYTQYCFDADMKNRYKDIDINFSPALENRYIGLLKNYNVHPTLNYKNFICSFNGTPHVSRKLLVSCLNRFGWFNPEYCSKNFSYSGVVLDGHIMSYTDKDSFYSKFFNSNNDEQFFETMYGFGHVRFDHANNIYNLEDKLTQSFVHIVSETMATSYYPFFTEKFLYSVVTRGLFLSYAQPGWHQHLEQYFGFKPYKNIFDYRFDSIQNPIERLVELMSMISKFSMLTPYEWHDLYLLEQDTIEYNYDHYFSSRYFEQLKSC